MQQNANANANAKKLFQAYLTLEKTPSGTISASGSLRSDGKMNAMLEISLANTIQKSVHEISCSFSLQQTLFLPVIADLHLYLSANSSSDGYCIVHF